MNTHLQPASELNSVRELSLDEIEHVSGAAKNEPMQVRFLCWTIQARDGAWAVWDHCNPPQDGGPVSWGEA